MYSLILFKKQICQKKFVFNKDKEGSGEFPISPPSKSKNKVLQRNIKAKCIQTGWFFCEVCNILNKN